MAIVSRSLGTEIVKVFGFPRIRSLDALAGIVCPLTLPLPIRVRENQLLRQLSTLFTTYTLSTLSINYTSVALDCPGC